MWILKINECINIKEQCHNISIQHVCVTSHHARVITVVSCRSRAHDSDLFVLTQSRVAYIVTLTISCTNIIDPQKTSIITPFFRSSGQDGDRSQQKNSAEIENNNNKEGNS